MMVVVFILYLDGDTWKKLSLTARMRGVYHNFFHFGSTNLDLLWIELFSYISGA